MRLKDLEEGKKVAGDCRRAEGSQPEWLDMQTYDKAREVYQDNLYSIMLAHSCGPVLVGHVSSLALPVKFTGKSETVPLACKRLANTVHHVLSWYKGNIWDKGDYAYESVQQIRRLHGRVVQSMTEAGENSPEEGVWLSQYDMALTQFAFMGAVVLAPQKLGIQCSEQDIECLLHFWRGVGYQLGMEDRFNICAGNFQEIKTLFQEIVDQVVYPTLSNPQKECQKLIDNGVQALKTHCPFIEDTSFVNFSLGLVDFPEKKSLTWYGQVCQWIRSIYVQILSIAWFRQLTNQLAGAILQERSTTLRKNSPPTRKSKNEPLSAGSLLLAFVQRILLVDKNNFKT